MTERAGRAHTNAGEATSVLPALSAAEVCRADRLDWEVGKISTALKTFINAHPDGTWPDEVSARIIDTAFEVILGTRRRTDEERLALCQVVGALSSHPKVSALLTTVLDVFFQRQEFASLVAINAWLSRLADPIADCHKLVIDNRRLSDGPFCFESESGYLSGMLRGLNYMLDTLDQPLDVALYEALHDHCVAGTRRDGNTLFRLGFREGQVHFHLCGFKTEAGHAQYLTSANASEGWSRVVPLPDDRICSAPSGGTCTVLETAAHSPTQCAEKAEEILAQYHTDIGLAQALDTPSARETAKLTAIAACCVNLDQHHLFEDGNIRTIVFLTMNKLLMQNGYSPALWHDPNAIDMRSVSEVVQLIREGQTSYAELLAPQATDT